MIPFDLTDTIAAIATTVGDSGIGIVRLSGKEALAIADRIFFSKGSGKPSEFGTFTMHYGWVAEDIRESSPRNIIDEVILTVMRSPRSYTKEDVVEINCHGGIVATRQVLDLVLRCGARLASPGEFTKRAFLNGRIDLAQAEAVLDIIRAKTDSALKAGMEQLKGNLSKRINRIRRDLLGLLSEIEAGIDFPEEDISAAGPKDRKRRLADASWMLRGILESSGRGRVLREGIKAVICGRPNVGKSSLLNALLKQERSIVTPIAGTTRDTIEEIIDIKGIPVVIIDTAGILEPRDLIEKKAMQRSKKYIASCDLVFLLFDGSRKLTKEDLMLIRKLKDRPVIAMINKTDLKPKIEKEKLNGIFGRVIEISAKRSKNINLLEDAVAEMVYKGKSGPGESVLISNLRHIEQLRLAEKSVAGAINSLDNDLPAEFVAQGIKDALGHIDNLLGRNFSEDLLDKIFSEFCIGK